MMLINFEQSVKASQSAESQSQNIYFANVNCIYTQPIHIQPACLTFFNTCEAK